MNKKRKTGIAAIVFVVLMAVALVVLLFVNKDKRTDSNPDTKKIMEQIVEWKKASNNIEAGQPLIGSEYTSLAGSTAGDWFVFAMARMGVEDDYAAYEDALVKNIISRYKENGGLDANKATEWHRIGLTMTAMGYDPTKIEAGETTIDLVKDGTYDRGKTASLDTQGLNGYIWALLLLDSKEYEVPKDAYETREDMVEQILTYQGESGAFGLIEGEESVDITAMAITSLAKYKDQEKVKASIEKALAYLSNNQTEQGTFKERDTESSESCSQVLVALTSLDINPYEDERFIKKGNTVVDGLYSFRNADGGFRHSTDKEEASNAMASEQALYAYVALDRFTEGKSSLYQF